MRPLFTAAQVAAATGGELVSGAAEAFFSGVQVDSRRVVPGDLFVALAGERTDGHRFLEEVLAQGAGALVRDMPQEVPPGKVLIRVPDTAQAILDLAAFHLGRFQVRVVGVTGSVGKTGTKEYIAAALSQRFPTLKSEGNYNTGIGLPLTLFRLEEHHQVAVLEMGMRGRGEIAALARTAKPEVGVITTVGESHLELLGSVEEIARAKGELLEALPPTGLAVLNGDDARCRALARTCPCPVVFFGLGEADVSAREVTSLGATGMRFRLVAPQGEEWVTLAQPGEHQVRNALAAAAVALHFGVPPAAVAQGLATATAAPGRGRPERLGEVLLLDDSYNASPASAEAALAVLRDLPARRRLALLGPMRELGEYSQRGHRRVGAAAARAGLDYLLLTGEGSEFIGDGAREVGTPEQQILSFPDAEAAGRFLQAELGPGDCLLIKASRAEGLDWVAAHLRRELAGQ